MGCNILMEAATRFELVNSGFADRCLTPWLCRLFLNKVERETGFEPATSTLARSHSTTELFPLIFIIIDSLILNLTELTVGHL